MNKPSPKHVTFRRAEGNYSLFNPEEVKAQYIFTIPHLTREQINEMDLRLNYSVDIEHDPHIEPDGIYSALDVAHEIQAAYDSYWIHTGKDKINKLIDYLESIEEEQIKLQHEYEVENTEYQIHYWQEKLEKLKEEGEFL